MERPCLASAGLLGLILVFGGGPALATHCPLGPGAAATCAVLQLGGGKVDMTGPPGGVVGNVCIGADGKLSMSGSQYVDGAARLAGAEFSKCDSPDVLERIYAGCQPAAELSAETLDAELLSTAARSLACDQSLGVLKQSRTLSALKSGLNVICVEGIELSGGKQLVLSGPPGSTFVVNVTGKKFKLSGGSDLRVAGGIGADAVLYNLIGTGEDVALSGGGGGEHCCEALVEGTILALERKIKLSPGLVVGGLISRRNITLSSGAAVRHAPLRCLDDPRGGFEVG